MRVGGIGTRYAAWIAALALALVATALVAAGVIAFRESRLVQAEIHEAVGTARAADEEAALQGTARYLGAQLFNALYQLDVERLNEEIERVRDLAADRFVPGGRQGRGTFSPTARPPTRATATFRRRAARGGGRATARPQRGGRGAPLRHRLGRGRRPVGAS